MAAAVSAHKTRCGCSPRTANDFGSREGLSAWLSSPRRGVPGETLPASIIRESQKPDDLHTDKTINMIGLTFLLLDNKKDSNGCEILLESYCDHTSTGREAEVAEEIAVA